MAGFSFKNLIGTKDNKTETAVIEVKCPSCKVQQGVTKGAVSAFCKSCKKIFEIQKALQIIETESKNAVAASPEDNYTQDSKRIRCTGCATWQDVPVIAISAFCKKCGQRINLQDYKKTNFFRGDLDTKGTLFITATGEVEGTVNVGEAIIEGKFRGKLFAERLVKLEPGALFFGELHSPAVAMSDGATFVGRSQISPSVIDDDNQ